MNESSDSEFDLTQPYTVLDAGPVQPSSPSSEDEFDLSKPYEDLSAKEEGLEGLAKTIAEQFFSGATLGGTEVVETKTGLATPQEIEVRARMRPITATLANIAGTATTLGLTGGLGALAPGAGVLGRLGIAGLEGATIGGVTQANDAWSKDKPLDAQLIVAHAGLGGLLGLAAGGLLEAYKYRYGTTLAPEINKIIESEGKVSEQRPIVSQADAKKYAEGDFKTFVENSEVPDSEIPKVLEGMKDLKKNTPEIIKAAHNIGAPVHEGMISESPYVQRIVDSWLKGPPTYVAQKTLETYQKIWTAIRNTVEQNLGQGAIHTKFELGELLKDNLTKRIQTEHAPLNALYLELEQVYQMIPLSEKAPLAVANRLKKLKEVRVSPSSPEAKLVTSRLKEIENLKTVDDVKTFRSVNRRSIPKLASSGEKRMISIMDDELRNLEEESIIRFGKLKAANNAEAEKYIQDVLRLRKEANAAYAPFKEDLEILADQIGRREVYGAQDAINFIEEGLTSEKLVNKLFSKDNVEFARFFAKKFPEEMELMRQYQKGVIIDKARSQATGEILINSVFKEINKLAPEIQNIIFSKSELEFLKSAEVVQQSLPKDFNPSHTSHATSMEYFFTNPRNAILKNLSDKAKKDFIVKSGAAGNVVRSANEAFQKNAKSMEKEIDAGVKSIFLSKER
jgi:hypothetical protein